MDRPQTLKTPAEIADYLNVPPDTLRTWRYRQTGPKFYKLGNLVRYKLDDVERWLAAQSRA